MKLGEYLIQARRDRGFSQRDLAARCGISPAEVSRVESGVRMKPAPAVLRAMADALVVSYPRLMQLAGYIEETHEEEDVLEQVFRDVAAVSREQVCDGSTVLPYMASAGVVISGK